MEIHESATPAKRVCDAHRWSLPCMAAMIPLCSKCGYELRGLPPRGVCPECGQKYDAVKNRGIRLPETPEERGSRLMRKVVRWFLVAAGAAIVGFAIYLYHRDKTVVPLYVIAPIGFCMMIVSVISHLTSEDRH